MFRWLISLGLLLLTALPAAAARYGLPLDQREQAAMAETFHYAMEHNPSGEESTWVNPETGHSGAIVPIRSFYSSAGQSCREYIQTLDIAGSIDRRLGIACRQNDGVWAVMHEQFLSDAELTRSAPQVVYVYRDPYEYDYPWVYYDPFDYPHPIFFSFIFVSRHQHFHHKHFHSGYHFRTPHFRDGRPQRPQQRLHRDRAEERPLLRDAPTAPRFAPAPDTRSPRGDGIEHSDQPRRQPPAAPAAPLRVTRPPTQPQPADPVDRAPRLQRDTPRQSGGEEGALRENRGRRGGDEDRGGSSLRQRSDDRGSDRGRRGGGQRSFDRGERRSGSGSGSWDRR